MTDLQEVRRYWPKAKPNGQLCIGGVTVVSWYRSHRGKCASIRIEPVGCRVVVQGSTALTYDAATIPEAMRAAGFGRKPEYAMKGHHFAADRRRIEGGRLALRSWRAGVGRMPPWLVRATEPFNRLPALTINQRPRKGARLGRRKREALRRIEEPEDCSSVTKYGATGAGAWCARQAGVM